MGVNNSPNMNLPVPQVGIEPGPQYATDINSCMALVDAHDHSPGNGVQITPSGLNINADLTTNNNNLTNLRSVRFQSQSTVLSNPSDLGCLYESGVDLYYNDGNGNQVRITESGGVAGTPGSISNLTSPASASYVSGNQTFVWQSAANTPANLDAASIILRNLVASSKGLTLSPPNSMAADFSITLPTLPASTLPVSISTAGVMSASTITYAQLNSTIQTYINTVPTQQIFTSGSGTYTTPANVTYIRVRMVGGGGGGGGAAGASTGSAPGGSPGSQTTFGTSLLTASGGGGGGGTGNTFGGDGGTTVVNSPAIGMGWTGGSGCDPTGLGISGVGGGTGVGGAGAGTPFGGTGGGGQGKGEAGSPNSGSSVGHDGAANTGAGGGGGGISTTDVEAQSGGGGGAGGYIDCIIGSPASTYAYSVGPGGAFGAGVTGGSNGGNGASGIIIVEEHYGS